MGRRFINNTLLWGLPIVLVLAGFILLKSTALFFTILIGVGLFYLAALYNNLKVGVYTILLYSFMLSPLSRYLWFYGRVDIPWGMIVDALIFLMLLIYVIKHRGYYEWFRLNNDLMKLWGVWFAYTLLQIANPGVISYESYYINFRSETFYVITVMMLTFLVFYKYKDFKTMTILWAVLASFGSLKGIGQLAIGLDPPEYAFVHKPGNHTHLLFGQLRVFSFFPDAGTFGASQAQNAVFSGILFLELKNSKEKLFQLVAFILALVGMGISGTRGALFVIFGGGMIYFLLKGKKSWLITGFVVMSLLFVFLKYTRIMHGNSQIRRMRTALDPQDASFQARISNQIKLTSFMNHRPFGYGLGTIGVRARQLTPYSPLARIPTDSWYVRIWVENGIIGLLLYFLILLWMMIKGALLIKKVKNHELKARLIAVHSAICGILVASYGNEIFGQHPISIYSYVSLAFIFLAPQMDKELENIS